MELGVLILDIEIKRDTCKAIQPGPASSEGERPSTNPVIRVRFSMAQQMDISFASVAENISDFDLFGKISL